ncbi:hypothetical protein [Bacillus wiedmannii]|uniref:hypothetical protein n=1 Tax=Bacillus wiedmannii TaxID=1890302 RepID=UPI003F671B00
MQRVTILADRLATKADITYVRGIVKESVGIKKIEYIKAVGMDCKVGISLGGKVVADSIIEHTADSIQGRLIKGSEINEIN